MRNGQLNKMELERLQRAASDLGRLVDVLPAFDKCSAEEKLTLERLLSAVAPLRAILKSQNVGKSAASDLPRRVGDEGGR